MKITITHDLPAGRYESDDARIKLDAGVAGDSELTLDFQIAAEPPVVVDPPPVVDPPAPPAPPVDPPAPPVPPVPPPAADAPVAQFTATVADNGYDVSLVDTSTNVAKEQWAYNGGTSTVIGSRTATFKKAGTYPIKLIVWNAAGKSSSLTVSVTTTADAPVALPPPPQAPSSAKAAFNGSVARNVLTVSNFSAGAVSGVWDWGDGTTDDMSVKTHTYSTTGTFPVTLTVTAADGTTNKYTARFGAIVPSPIYTPPTADLFGQPVTLTAALDYVTGALPAELDVSITLNPGDFKLLIPGNPSGGAALYRADGKGVEIVNDAANSDGDVNGVFALEVGGTTLFSGRTIVPHGAGTRPFWLGQIKPKANPDLSCMPKLGPGSESASWADAYALGDNGVVGVGNILLAIGAGGEHPTLGPVPGWDACYLTNPSPENLSVVRGMADAIAPIPFRVRDFATGKMLDVRQYPRASRLGNQLGVGDNPISKFATIWPFSLDQAQSHATNYGALACELYGTDFDREMAAMWANYICCLNQNYLFRSKLGCCVFQHNAARGFGRGLTVLLNAARNAPDEFKPLFQSWVDEAAADGTAAWVGLPGMGIMRQGGALAGNVTAYAGGEYAGWMQDILTGSIGQALQYGHPKFQPILDTFAEYTFDRVLADHEFATLYNAVALRADGTWVDNWDEGLQVKAASDPAFAAALAAPEGSAERAKYTGGNPGDFMGYPTSATGYPAMYQAALAPCVRYATNQTKAQAAWAKFRQWQRIDYSANPKYNTVP